MRFIARVTLTLYKDAFLEIEAETLDDAWIYAEDALKNNSNIPWEEIYEGGTVVDAVYKQPNSANFPIDPK